MYRQSNIIKFPFDRWRLQTLVRGKSVSLSGGNVQETGHFDPSSAISDRWEEGVRKEREGDWDEGAYLLQGKGFLLKLCSTV